MSIRFSQGKLQGEERRTIVQEVQRQAKIAVLQAIRPILRGFLEEEVTAKLGREKGEVRRVSGQAREIDWQCGHCDCRDANHFTRDGHDRRSLVTGWGLVEGLPVPMVECQCCGHDVVSRYAVLEKYQRLWVDVDQRVLFESGLCQSLRHLSQDKLGRKRHQRSSRESGVARRIGILDGWQWETRGSGLAHRGWRKQSGMGSECRIGCGNEECARRRGCKR